MNREKSITTFGSDIVNEAEDVLTFLTDDSGAAMGSEASQQARNRYRSSKQTSEAESEIYQLEVILACFGKLTPPASERLEELRHRWSNDTEEFKIKIIDFDAMAEELRLSFVAPARPKLIKLKYKEGTSVNTREWGYALIPAIEFYKLFEKYKMALFDLNVRYYLERSSVNKEIIKTLDKTAGQKRFHLLNNGITVSSTSCSFSKNQSQVTLYNPQIINGCQTVVSIFRAYNQLDNTFKLQNFTEQCYVPMRVIQTQDHDLLAEIVTASNNQNKMSPRNLRSNSRVQRVLQRKFDQLEHRYFYERKDGEFKSIRDYGHGHHSPFRPINYQYSTRGYREISNEALAKAWLSFIGFSKDASEKINAFELMDDGGRYEWLFEKCPSAEHWSAVVQDSQVFAQRRKI